MAERSGWGGQPGTRHQRGYGSAWDRLRVGILARDMHLCQPCLAEGRATPARTVDHIKPKAKGGTDNPENLRAICDECHKAKTTAEGHEAKGQQVKSRVRFDADGRPVW